MRYVKLFLIIFSLITTLNAHATTAANLAITDPNKTIIVNQKDPTFKIRLNANPTTGYSWFMKQYDPLVITPVSTTFTPPKEAIPGRGGISTWTFRVSQTAFLVPTITTINLLYTQPWAFQGDNPGQNFTIVTMP